LNWLNDRAALFRSGRPGLVIQVEVAQEIDPSILNRNFQVNTMGLLYLARRFSPAMVTAGEGAIVVTGNTSALRGKPGFAGFAPTKAAQRILAETMARDLGPRGVHVAYVVVEAVVDLEWTRKRFQGRPDEFFIKPRAIADEIWHVVHKIGARGHSTLSYGPLEKPGSREDRCVAESGGAPESLVRQRLMTCKMQVIMYDV
jgi:NAD(P)-dependent dehydrogenase (short-subunit alcohol dehydrogenase family)